MTGGGVSSSGVSSSAGALSRSVRCVVYARVGSVAIDCAAADALTNRASLFSSASAASSHATCSLVVHKLGFLLVSLRAQLAPAAAGLTLHRLTVRACHVLSLCTDNAMLAFVLPVALWRAASRESRASLLVQLRRAAHAVESTAGVALRVLNTAQQTELERMSAHGGIAAHMALDTGNSGHIDGAAHSEVAPSHAGLHNAATLTPLFGVQHVLRALLTQDALHTRWMHSIVHATDDSALHSMPPSPTAALSPPAAGGALSPHNAAQCSASISSYLLSVPFGPSAASAAMHVTLSLSSGAAASALTPAHTDTLHTPLGGGARWKLVEVLLRALTPSADAGGASTQSDTAANTLTHSSTAVSSGASVGSTVAAGAAIPSTKPLALVFSGHTSCAPACIVHALPCDTLPIALHSPGGGGSATERAWLVCVETQPATHAAAAAAAAHTVQHRPIAGGIDEREAAAFMSAAEAVVLSSDCALSLALPSAHAVHAELRRFGSAAVQLVRDSGALPVWSAAHTSAAAVTDAQSLMEPPVVWPERSASPKTRSALWSALRRAAHSIAADFLNAQQTDALRVHADALLPAPLPATVEGRAPSDAPSADTTTTTVTAESTHSTTAHRRSTSRTAAAEPAHSASSAVASLHPVTSSTTVCATASHRNGEHGGYDTQCASPPGGLLQHGTSGASAPQRTLARLSSDALAAALVPLPPSVAGTPLPSPPGSAMHSPTVPSHFFGGNSAGQWSVPSPHGTVQWSATSPNGAAQSQWSAPPSALGKAPAVMAPLKRVPVAPLASLPPSSVHAHARSAQHSLSEHTASGAALMQAGAFTDYSTTHSNAAEPVNLGTGSFHLRRMRSRGASVGELIALGDSSSASASANRMYTPPIGNGLPPPQFPLTPVPPPSLAAGASGSRRGSFQRMQTAAEVELDLNTPRLQTSVQDEAYHASSVSRASARRRTGEAAMFPPVQGNRRSAGSGNYASLADKLQQHASAAQNLIATTHTATSNR